MNRFDTVMLEDGRIATVIGVEKMLGKETGHVLVSIAELKAPIVVDLSELSLVKKYVAPKTYPHINEQTY